MRKWAINGVKITESSIIIDNSPRLNRHSEWNIFEYKTFEKLQLLRQLLEFKMTKDYFWFAFSLFIWFMDLMHFFVSEKNFKPCTILVTQKWNNFSHIINPSDPFQSPWDDLHNGDKSSSLHKDFIWEQIKIMPVFDQLCPTPPNPLKIKKYCAKNLLLSYLI